MVFVPRAEVHCKFTADHGRPVCRARGARAPRFCKANVKFLILTIGAPPPDFDLYCALPVLLMCLPPVLIVTGRPCCRFYFISFITSYF